MAAMVPEAVLGVRVEGRADGVWATVLWAGVGVLAFEGAFAGLGFLMGVFLFAVVRVSFAKTARGAFYVTFLMMGVCYGIPLRFFWGIFGVGAVALWGFLAIWVAGFVLIVRGLRGVFPKWGWVVMLPVVWTGMEYFRCEWNPLRFSWLVPGWAVGTSEMLRLLGVYGCGMAAMAVVAVLVYFLEGRRWMWSILVVAESFFVVAAVVIGFDRAEIFNGAIHYPQFVGIQLEEAAPGEILAALDKAVARYPGAVMFVLGEYSVMGPPPERILAWARGHGKYVLLGGVDYVAGKDGDETNYYDTAYVIGPEGRVVFSQAKAVPIQVMKDGLAAKEQRVWDSPWGKVGICICYDLSYRRVTDELIRQGAQVLIVPAMDAESWGRAEHELHALVAPVRAAEYGVPVFRVGTSGISQSVNTLGGVRASAGFPGQGEMMADEVRFVHRGAVPMDWIFGPAAAVGTAGVVFGMMARYLTRQFRGKGAKFESS